MRIKEQKIPSDSLIETALNRTDYWDSFSVEVPIPSDEILEQMPISFFKVTPNWFRYLMYFRERIAKMIGLKTGEGANVEQQLKEFKGEVGQSISLFHVLGRTEEEIMVGESDSHLDFRLSYFAIPKSEMVTELHLSTTVEFNNWLGRLYFLPVGPIHRIIVPITVSYTHLTLPTNREV